MGEALLWGLVAGSSLVVGAAVALAMRPGHRAIGLMMGFGAGALISAVAYELVGDAFEVSGGDGVWAGLAAGALAFYFGNRVIAQRGGGERKRSRQAPDPSQHKAIVLGTVLDGIPEGIVLGMSLIGGGGGSAAMIGAVFMSNLPEATAATSGLEASGMSRRRLLWMWSGIAVATGIAALVGFAVFDTASDGAIAFTQSFAAGALLTMLANTMLPEAVEEGGQEVGLVTVLGFAVAFALAELA
jgi:ZIP family zinc transporter